MNNLHSSPPQFAQTILELTRGGELTVLSMNDFPIGVYTSEKEASEAITKVRKQIKEGNSCLRLPPYIQDGDESIKDEFIKARFHFYCRSFILNEVCPCPK